MLSWRELPNCRVIGSSPVWYQSGTKVIALSAFFNASTQPELSYTALGVVEQIADSFNASLDAKSSCVIAVQETSVDTFSSLSVSPRAVRLSVKEAFFDTAESSSKVTDTALAVIVEQTSDVPHFGVNLKVSNSLSVQEQFSDAYAAGVKVTAKSTAVIVEQSSDVAHLQVQVARKLAMATSESFKDVASIAARSVITARVAFQELMTDTANARLQSIAKLSAAVSEELSDKLSIATRAVSSTMLGVQEQVEDGFDAKVVGSNLVDLAAVEQTSDSFGATVVGSHVLELSIREDSTDKIDMKFAAKITSNLAFSELFQDNGNFTLVDTDFKSGEVLHFIATRLVDFEFVATSPLYDSFIAAKNASKFVAKKNYVHLYSEVPSSIFIEANKQDSATLIARRS